VRRGVFFEMPWNWLALAAAIAVAAIVASSFLPRLTQPGADQFLATQLIASHIRSLMADHLTDVASSDQHTVKPWLDVKLDFAAPVVDLSGDGFPLIGGRLDYLDNHSAAALVYQRRKHFINLFIWPTTPADSKEQKVVEREGYHLVHWADGDFTYWAVSDVNIIDLETFKRSFEQQVRPH
jgi:anti-sigma factor RsiW